MEHRDYSGAIRWQLEHGVPPSTVARLFDKAESSLKVIAWRDANRLIPRKVEDVLRNVKSAGMAVDELLRDVEIEEDEVQVPLTAAKLERQIDNFGRHFWEKVKDHKGAKELGLLLRRASKPSWENLPLRRARAKLYHLLAEIYVHAGCCRSSLKFAVKAYRAEEQLYKETLSRDELFSIGRTAFLISQALTNRTEYYEAVPWIERGRAALEAGSFILDTQYYRQLGTVQFHIGDLAAASKNFRYTLEKPRAPWQANTPAAVRDGGERYLNLASDMVNWESAFEFMEFSLRNWPEWDIHRALNVNCGAAAGLMSDSTEANRRALELLSDKGDLSKGYLHPQTVTELLLMTPRLPKKLRPHWVRFSLHYNAFRNR